MRNQIGSALLVGLTLLVVSPASGEPADQARKELTATVGADGVQRVEVVGGSYFFNPNYVIVKANVPVELTVRKEAGVAVHNIVARFPEAGIDFAIDLAKSPRTVTFTPTKAGTYPFSCTKRFLFFASHKERGMEGILDVRD